MARLKLARRTWHGDEILARARRANGRAIVGMGEQASAQMTRAAHAISGDLKRSVHVAPEHTMGVPEIGGTGFAAGESAALREGGRLGVEVGSWLPYACVENNRGGAHRFADIGWDAARPTFDTKLVRAWREEGL